MAIDGVLDIPEDVMLEILARLPVKSLLRLKCVCKSWYALINNPSFITKHLNYTSLDDVNTGGFALVRWNSDKSKAIVGLLSNEAIELTHDIAMPFFGDVNFFDRRFYSHCNGIICVSGFRYYDVDSRHGPIALWNPATRQFKQLSFSEVLPCQEDVEPFQDEFGFGYDPKSNDYKVVRIRCFRYKSSRTVLDKPLVEVYNLSTDSWKNINAVMPKKLQCMDAFSTYLNGFYYWWACDEDGAFVLSFDFADEVFERIPPPDMNDPSDLDRTVIQFNESIAVAVGELIGGEYWENVEVWVLNTDGERKTWNKQLTIPSSSSSVLGFLRNGEALLRNCIGCLISYDPRTQEFKVRQNYCLDIASYIDIRLQIASYVESLVPLKGACQLDYSDGS